MVVLAVLSNLSRDLASNTAGQLMMRNAHIANRLLVVITAAVQVPHPKPARLYRIANEVPTLAMIAIVILVVVKLF